MFKRQYNRNEQHRTRTILCSPFPSGKQAIRVEHRVFSEQSEEYTMKKILFIAILAGAAYFGYKKFTA